MIGVICILYWRMMQNAVDSVIITNRDFVVKEQIQIRIAKK